MYVFIYWWKIAQDMFWLHDWGSFLVHLCDLLPVLAATQTLFLKNESKKRSHDKYLPWKSWNILDFLYVTITTVVDHNALICTDRMSLKEVSTCFSCCLFCYFIAVKFAPPHANMSLVVPSHPSSFSPPTGNRWEVKGVTCRGSGLLPLACQSLITHTRAVSPYIPWGRWVSAGSHYRCRPSTHKYLYRNTPTAL